MTLRRGIDADGSLWPWYQEGLAGRPSPRDCSLSVLDQRGATTQVYRLINVLPLKVEIGQRMPGSTGVHIGTVVLSCDHFEPA